MAKPNIIFITDFGLKDNFVGVMKGVISGITPDANIIDITHDIEPQNYKQAAFILAQSVKYFPKGSIFVCIVDPGVGSARNIIAIKTQDFIFLSPDNGILSYILSNYTPEGIFSLTNKKYFLENISPTFHGRDIFAPVAAHLANGVEVEKMGERISPISIIKIPDPLCFLDTQNIWHGEIIHIDRFGNAITSLKANLLDLSTDNFPKQELNWIFETGNIKIRYLSQTFSDVDVGNYLAFIGSFGYIEIGLREGNAAKKTKFELGQNVYAYKF